MTDSMDKPARLSDLTDNETTNDSSTVIKEWEQALSENKALKKKLKKMKQKITKKNDKANTEMSREADVSKDVVNMKTMEYRDNGKSIDDVTANHDNTANDYDSNASKPDNDSENTDIDYFTTISPFIQSRVEQEGKKKIHKKNDVKRTDPFGDSDHRSNLSPADLNDFTLVAKGKKQTPVTFCKTPEGFGNEALIAITNENFPLAINYLTRAIALDPIDTRHYLNRSYCYLRMGNHSEALADIEYACSRLSDLNEISQAKCRKGQILSIIQNYEAAENAFSDSINLAPDRSSAERQLKRMQLDQIVQMGFNERDVLIALQEKSNTADAIHLLMSKSFRTNDNSYNTLDSISDDEIFYSDDDDCPSNEKLLSKLLNYDPNIPDRSIIPDPQPARAQTVKKLQQLPRAASVDRNLRVIKTVIPVAKVKPDDRGLNNKAVWVGNLIPEFTDEVIKQRFLKFGKVVCVARPRNGAYVFVNFQHTSSVQKALEEASYNGGNIILNGHNLYVKSATSRIFK